MTLQRYKTYRSIATDWLREIPAHWEVKSIKHVCHAFPSNVDKKSYEGQESVKLCNYVDVYYNDEITAELSFMSATASRDQVEKFTLKAGDTIITKDSETADDIAVAAYVPQNMPGIVCGYHLTIVRPGEGMFGRYVKRLFDSHFLKSQFAVSANGLTRVGLSQYAVDNAIVTVPPRNEQIAIATFLDREAGKIDALVAEQEKLIALLKEKRQAIISHAVTKGLNPSVPMKDSGIEWLGEVPVHWEVVRVGVLFNETSDVGTEDLPILSVSIHDGVSDKELSEDEMDRKVTRSDDVTKYKKVLPGDLVYNMMRAWQGGFGAVLVEGMVSPAYVVARPAVSFSTQFIELLLRTSKAVEEMRRHSHGVTDFRLRLYWDEFKTMKLAMPPEAEQLLILKEISRECSGIDTLTSEAERAIDLLKEHRSALISAAVTGKIDVRGLVAIDTTQEAPEAA